MTYITGLFSYLEEGIDLSNRGQYYIYQKMEPK
jgi:hypothetical protein